MQDDPSAHAERDERPGRTFDCAAIQRRRAPERDARELFGFVVVDEKHIDFRQHRRDVRGKTARRFAHAIDRGQQARRPRPREHFDRRWPAVGPERVERVEEQQITEVKPFCLGRGKIKMRGRELCVGPALMEKRASARRAYRHHIGVTGRDIVCTAELGWVDAVRGTIR